MPDYREEYYQKTKMLLLDDFRPEDVNMTIRYIRANNEVAKNKYEAVMR